MDQKQSTLNYGINLSSLRHILKKQNPIDLDTWNILL